LEEIISGRLKFKCKAEVELLVRDGQRWISEHQIARGDGPVHALDIASRKALRCFSVLEQIHLKDFRVRVLPGVREGTAAPVSVIIESANGKKSWRTVGVDENILRACTIALLESYEYAIWQETILSRRQENQVGKE
jgi:2-isopropylmalate synthase